MYPKADSSTKIPLVSAQSVTLAFAVIFSFQQNSQLFMRLIQELMTLQKPEASFKELEESLKTQIPPAAQLSCLLPLVEKVFLENRSCENAIAFFYVLFRLLHKHTGKVELSRKESIELWEQIWKFARQFPIVEHEWAQMEERNDLKAWKQNLQEYSRNKWKYFNSEQLPKYDERVKLVCDNIQTFLNIAPAEK